MQVAWFCQNGSCHFFIAFFKDFILYAKLKPCTLTMHDIMTQSLEFHRRIMETYIHTCSKIIVIEGPAVYSVIIPLNNTVIKLFFKLNLQKLNVTAEKSGSKGNKWCTIYFICCQMFFCECNNQLEFFFCEYLYCIRMLFLESTVHQTWTKELRCQINPFMSISSFMKRKQHLGYEPVTLRPK